MSDNKDSIKHQKLVHGGDWAGFEAQYGYRPLDFSANVSPLGTPTSIKQAIINALDDAARYPDPLCRELVEAIAQFEAVDANNIFCGNGAADLLFRMVLAISPKQALITAPAFSEYEEALQAANCQAVRYSLDEQKNFHLDDGFLNAITVETDMVFLCQPNNPTGVTDSMDYIEKVLEKCREMGAILMLDECFNEFLDRPKEHTMKGHIGENRHLIILKSFTKMYAMAGIRLGYCLSSNGELLGRMRRMGQPWAVSDPAQKAGVAALQEREYVKAVQKVIREERLWLMERLTQMEIRVVPGEANYLLMKSVPWLGGAMEQRGILIRDCSNYHGLEKGWYRIAVRTREENRKLIATMEEIYGQEILTDE